MEHQHGPSKKLDLFLDDVIEQIQYKPIRDEIKEELAAHIEDKKAEYVLGGMEESNAWNKAIENMGDAVEIGAHLNSVRKVQSNHLTVILIIALIVIGILGNIRVGIASNSEISFSDFFYYLYGIIIFLTVYYFGYENIVKHIKVYLTVIVGTLLLCLAFFIIQRPYGMYLSITILFSLELLSIPSIMGMAYFNRRKKYKSIHLTTVIVAVIIGTFSHLLGGYALTVNFILLITIYSTLLYMIATGMLEGKRRTKVFSWILSLGIALAVFALSFNGDFKYLIQQCFYPEEVAQNYFNDSYNSILIKDLLGKAKLVGTINLGHDELKSYYTSEWYFKNMDDSHYDYKMQYIERGDVTTLEDILPEHYQGNYRISYWILKYGLVLSIALILIVVAAYGMLIRMVGKIRNKLGKVLALSCILALVLQFAFYVMGNFGLQFGFFYSFPFVSEGKSSIITNAIFVGLACSAYRYDKVVKEEKRKIIHDNSCI